MSAPVLRLDKLRVAFGAPPRPLVAVDGVSLDLNPGEVLAVVGESGSGKSAMAQALLGLNRGPSTQFSGHVWHEGRDLIAASEAELRAIRGARMAMIFQDAAAALNPLQRVGDQIVEMIRLHRPLGRAAARAEARDLLAEVGIPEPADRLDAWPHELSGGMRQRVMIAMAIANDPAVLIADEPTTALDVTVQAQILELLRRLRDSRGAGIILITHDLGVVAELADRIAVMYAGRIVETAPADDFFAGPAHPYSWALMGAVPHIDRPPRRRLPAIPGAPPALDTPPAGCRFAPRCPARFGRCAEDPPLAPRPDTPAHLAACWLSPEAAEARRAAILTGEGAE